VVHLQQLNWIDDWPVIGIDKDGDGKGEPALTEHKPLIRGIHPLTTPQESDEFDSDTLSLQWQWQANPKLTWYCLLPGKTHLRLFAEKLPTERAPLTEAGNLLLQKFPAPSFTATTQVKFTPQWDGKRAGLTIMGEEYASLSITKVKNSFSLVLHTYKPGDENIETVAAEQPLPGDTVYLRVKVTAPKASCQFSYSLDGQQYNDIGTLFWAKPGKWIGAKVGLFCISEPSARNGGYADFDWFRVE
jgi:beta-xylosidase